MRGTRRVLVFNHFAVPRDQAGGTRHIELFSRLQGWESVIVAGRTNLITGRPQAACPGFIFVPVTPYRTNGLSRILNWISYFVAATVAGLWQRKPDVVYASSPHLLAGLAGLLVARVRRARFILEIRDLWPQILVDMGRMTERSPIFRVLRQLELFLYARAERIVVLAPGSRDALVLLGVPESKIECIPNAADPADFVPSTDRETLRERYGFTRLTGVYTGAHGPANGLDLLLDAAEEVSDLELDIVLVGDGILKTELVADARRRGLANVRFMDPIPKVEIPDLLAAADFGIHVLADVDLFRTAVSPNKVFDYMAAGLPIVTNSPGIVGSVVEEASAGYHASPEEMASLLKRIGTAPTSTHDCLGLSGYEWVQQHRTRRLTAEHLLNVLTSI